MAKKDKEGQKIIDKSTTGKLPKKAETQPLHSLRMTENGHTIIMGVINRLKTSSNSKIWYDQYINLITARRRKQ